jgi:Na+/proline symporter
MMITKSSRRPLVVMWILTACILFISIMGLGGGMAMLQDPNGSPMGLSPALLERTPFVDYTLPGIWLIVVFGIGGLVLLYCLWLLPNVPFLTRLTRWTHEHWAWDLTIAFGLVMLIWLTVQILMIQMLTPPQVLLFVLGVALVALPLLTPMRRYYAAHAL